MPNIKSAAKRVKTQSVRQVRNKSNRTRLKTTLKQFNTAVASENREEAVRSYTIAVKTVDKAASKGLIHKNNAARKKSSLARKLNTMN